FLCIHLHRTPSSTLFPYTTLFRSLVEETALRTHSIPGARRSGPLKRADQALVADCELLAPGVALNAQVEQVVRVDVSLQHIKALDRKSTRLNSSHVKISYAVFCLK